MIALVLGSMLLAAAASCLATLLRPAGFVAFALETGLLAFAEVVVVSHALSAFDAYERRWFLGALAVLAVVTTVAIVVSKPPRPPLPRIEALRSLIRDPLVAILAAMWSRNSAT